MSYGKRRLTAAPALPYSGHTDSSLRRRRTLRQTRERYRSLVENAAEGIFQTTPDGRYLLANPMLARIYGYDSPDELRRNLTDIAHQLYVEPDRRETFTQLMQEQDAVIGFESQARRRDGSLIWISECARAIRDADGNLLGYEGSVRDITARKQAEAEREKALDALRTAREQLEDRVRERTQELERVHRELAETAAEKKRFYREVIRCVTRDRFHLTDLADLPTPSVPPTREFALTGPEVYADLRSTVKQTACDAGLTKDAAADLVLAVGEAATNAIKHAPNGASCLLYQTSESIVVTVRDEGKGIRTDDLPASLLMPGFSKAVSLGMGFTLMLEMVDRVWLATEPGGTVVQLEKYLQPTMPTDDLAATIAAWGQL